MKYALLIACAATVLAAGSPAQPAENASPAAQAHFFTGVWQVKETDKPGVVVTLADDSGSLAGTIVFDIYKKQTNEHIATEPRTMLHPHMEGNALAFQVKRILKPHLKGDPPEDPSDTDIADMTLVPTADGNLILNCPKCGANAPTELVKAH